MFLKKPFLHSENKLKFSLVERCVPRIDDMAHIHPSIHPSTSIHPSHTTVTSSLRSFLPNPNSHSPDSDRIDGDAALPSAAATPLSIQIPLAAAPLPHCHTSPLAAASLSATHLSPRHWSATSGNVEASGRWIRHRRGPSISNSNKGAAAPWLPPTTWRGPEPPTSLGWVPDEQPRGMMLMALRPRPLTIPPVLWLVEAAARKVLLRLHPTEEAERRRHRGVAYAKNILGCEVPPPSPSHPMRNPRTFGLLWLRVSFCKMLFVQG